jgi:nicotinamide-nucleotide amidase
VVTIGDELLRGEIVDSNKSFLSERMLELDLESTRHVSVRDDPGPIVEVLRAAASQARVVLVSGGLGPTRDDITTETAAKAFGRKLVRDPQALERIRAFFSSSGRKMAENNAKQADFPEGAEILENPIGTAPGFMLDVDDCLLFFMPGVPRELYRMTDEEVLPRLRARLDGGGVVRSVLLRTFGVGESDLDRMLDDLVRDDPMAQLGFRTQFPDNLIRLVVRGADEAEAEAKLGTLLAQVRELLDDLLLGEDDRHLEEIVGELLQDQGVTIALAESCTGGLLSSRLTDVPGSSGYLLESLVAYSNDAKIRDLGVSAADIATHGAVSETVAAQMAEGVRRLSGADIGVATTGIAGPGGGTQEKPVGTVCIALADAEGTLSRRYQLMRERGRNKQLATQVALDWVRRRLLGLENTEETFPRLRVSGRSAR